MEIQDVCKESIKRGKGRPTETGIKFDHDYFKNYYHLKKEDIICECGQVISKKCIGKHLKRDRHTRAMTLKNKST